MIDPGTLATTIQTHIATTVDEHIRQYVGNIIQELSLDSAWIGKIEKQINDEISRRFGQRLSLIDIETLIAQSMDAAIDRYYLRQPQPQKGLVDQAHQQELIISDGSVVVSNDLTTRQIEIARDAVVGGTLTVQNLAIRGTINTDLRAWQQLTTDLSDMTVQRVDQEWRQRMIDQVREQITRDGIDFDQVTVAGLPLIQNHRLNDHITASNLQTVGTLDQLSVRGPADISDSLSVRAKRIGINTQHPEMALAIWDEETALMFGKHRENTSYIGTSRPQRLVIGINRLPAIDITEQGRVTINHLTVGRHRVCHEPEIPNYSGTKGDIVFNSNPRGDGVWAWQCLGAFKWTPLRSA